MKRRLAILVVLLGLAAVVALPAQAATVADFRGIWTSTDAVDGSNQVMIIGNSLRIVLIDDSATACGGPPAIVTGRGTIDDDNLNFAFRLQCAGGGGSFTESIDFELVAPGSLVDETGTVWTRVLP
jgi:hypothetical protein